MLDKINNSLKFKTKKIKKQNNNNNKKENTMKNSTQKFIKYSSIALLSVALAPCYVC